jgi:ornithine decarboxylase
MSKQPQTPYLTIDLASVTNAYRQLRQAMPDVTIYYAVKSNPYPEIIKQIAKIGGSFEIASATEMDLLTGVGIDAKSLLFTNPVKMPSHIRRAHTAGIWRYSFDSSVELSKIATDAPGAAVFVRLQAPHFESGVASEGKFGVDTDTAYKLMFEAKTLGLRPYGIAFHVGSQMESPKPWELAIQKAATLMERLQQHGITLETLDIGGGFPGYYGVQLPSIAEYGKRITKALKQYLPYKVHIAAEPGRYLVANAGVLTSTIIGIAKRGSKTWLHLDVGAFNGMMEALETQNTLHFPVKDSLNSTKTARYHLTGPSCDSQDSILFDVALSEGLTVGDKIFIHSAGAYTTCYASTFNGFAIPQTITT